jgi:hypothetical protein
VNPDFLALFEFRERWAHLADDHLASIGRFKVPATVSYFGRGIEVSDDSYVLIKTRAGPSDGAIEIEETHILNSNFLHLDFNPEWQRYEFDDGSGILTITGNSQKMRGPYKVTVEPKD